MCVYFDYKIILAAKNLILQHLLDSFAMSIDMKSS